MALPSSRVLGLTALRAAAVHQTPLQGAAAGIVTRLQLPLAQLFLIGRDIAQQQGGLVDEFRAVLP